MLWGADKKRRIEFFFVQLGLLWYRAAQIPRVVQNSSTFMKVAYTTFCGTIGNLEVPKANRRLECLFGGCALAVVRPWP